MLIGPGQLQWIKGDEPCLNHDPELWFSYEDHDKAKAMRICERCPQRAECYQHAMANREIGIWGGTTDEQRKAMRRYLANKGK